MSNFAVSLPTDKNPKQYWTGLHGSYTALAIHHATLESKSFILLICEDNQTVEQLSEALTFLGENRYPILHFPDWETLPYDYFSPHHDITSERLRVLARLPRETNGILLISANTLSHRLAPTDYINAHSFVLEKGDALQRETLTQQLIRTGYYCVSQVTTHGEFALRGSLIDIFPMGSSTPYRIDCFDDTIDTIRTFDPNTQRSLEIIDHINLLPAREFPLTEKGITHFRQAYRDKFPGDPMQSVLYQDISKGLAPAGIEYYLPLFFETTSTLLDYLPANTLIITLGNIAKKLQAFWQEVFERYSQYSHNVTRPLLAPEILFLKSNELFVQINQFKQIRITPEKPESVEDVQTFSTPILPSLLIVGQKANPIAALQDFLSSHADQRILFCADSNGRREALVGLLKPNDIVPVIFEKFSDVIASKARYALIVSPINEGMILPEYHLIVITETELFGQPTILQRKSPKQREQDPETLIKNLAELTPDTFVVHLEHGIGRYKGLQTLTVGGHTAEFLRLEYANNDTLYVPIDALHMINRYSSAANDNVHVHKLGTSTWQKTKEKAAKRIYDVAAELLNVYAQRESKPGFVFSKADEHYQAFAANFLFEETTGQSTAIQQVMEDMTSTKKMDRLICGDVGFGKTEVAMRAAFLAVHGGKQVAVLVPTTLLAQQHFDNFSDRFANWPVRIALLSRFRTKKENDAALKAAQEGQVDIIIGTHALLSSGVKFKNLGLLVIDEEHRFGVKQKEKLKAWCAEVDVLTLTATPIPRTLNMAMNGVRDLSIIATPPKRRLAIKTFVSERNPVLIREAILREILRGGQVYFLHNNVSTIEKTAESLRTLVPEARINVAHGQMKESELEKIMADFYHHRFHVLVCTTIIETGIDIPTANTIIIDRADKFGLAQLHQLRGRVGRSHHQAYAYLFTPPKDLLTSDAGKRLEALASLEDLGAGFMLAIHDLEIRGAGELLGEEQSGHIQEVGFSLYMELLERAVAALKSGKMPDINTMTPQSTEINLQMSALIPEDYLPDVHTRLVLYKRLATCATEAALRELKVEMIDRFGLLPPALKNLFDISEIRLKAKALGIHKIDAHAQGGKFEFEKETHFDPMHLIEMIQKNPKNYKLEGTSKLSFKAQLGEEQQRIGFIRELLDKLRNNTPLNTQ